MAYKAQFLQEKQKSMSLNGTYVDMINVNISVAAFTAFSLPCGSIFFIKKAKSLKAKKAYKINA